MTSIYIREVMRTDSDCEHIFKQVALIWIDAQKTTFYPLFKQRNPSLYATLLDDPDVLSIDRIVKAFKLTMRYYFKLAVAVQDEKIVGYVLFIPLNFSDESINFLDRVFGGKRDDLTSEEQAEFKRFISTDQLYIEEFMVHSSVQRKGVGTLLLEHVLNYGRDHGFMQCVVVTVEQNEKACNFYEKLGFSKQKSFLDKNGVGVAAYEKRLTA